MAKYEVTYSLGNRGESGHGAFIGESTMQYQRMTVEANGPNTAQRIVESMFGGPQRCLVNSVFEKR